MTKRAQDTSTTDEDAALVARAMSGDDQALELLLRRFRPFVRAKARPFFLAGGDREDVIQEGMVGLYKAIRDFDPASQVAFRGFADVCITRQIITAVKAAARHKHRPLNRYVSLHLPAHDHSEGDDTLLDRVVSGLPDPAEAAVGAADLRRFSRFCGAVLSDLEAEVLQRYVSGESYQEIADVLNRQVKAIDNAIQRIKRKLEPYLAEREQLEHAV